MGTADMDVILLSKSAKHGKYCVAGIHAQTGDFVRLCSEDEVTGGALSLDEMQYDDGSFGATLDVARIFVKGKKPLLTQPENVVIDPNRRWHKIGKCGVTDLDKYFSKESHGLIYGSNSPIATQENVRQSGKSLLLVKANDIVFYKIENAQGVLKSKVDFTVNGTLHEEYSMTDPRFYHVQDREKISNAILLVSIPSDAPFYKFVATIFTSNI